MEKRTIEISLETAKEWFKKEGDLKTLALQAFSEEELVPVITYKDFKEMAFSVTALGALQGNWEHSFNSYSLASIASAAKAASQLSKILFMTEGWIKETSNRKDTYYCLHYNRIKSQMQVQVLFTSDFGSILNFETREQAEKFLKQHEDLIKEYLRLQ